MQFITCASYYGTGSSAITDFIAEFDNIYSFTNEEFRFVQDPDGISDLEYNLVENFNRHNSGHALKRYKRLVDFYGGSLLDKKYERFFHGNWKKYSYEYIEELTEFKYYGWWLYDLLDRGYFFYFRKRCINKLLHLTFWKNQPERTFNSMKNEITYCSHPEEAEFLKITRRYLEKLFGSVSKDKKTVMVDQIVPPTNLERYIRYFNDIKVIVVDRDPRDIYVLDKYEWKDGMLPSDVELFCKWYRYTREHRQKENLDTDKIQFVQFEDLVYQYDIVSEKLINWLRLDKKCHIRKQELFIPSQSAKNTQTWKRLPCKTEEIAYIEKELKDYLYKFPVIN